MTTTPVSSSDGTLSSYITAQQQAAAAAAAAQAAASGGTGSNSLTGVTGNLNTFLNILTTQLKNQDPTAATDTNQFTQELVQFAGVEQQLNTNSNLTTLINLQKSNGGLSSGIGYLNNYVEAPANGMVPLQGGQAEIAYTLPAGVTAATITVQDASGNTVATLTGQTAAGLDRVSWDGKDSSGNQLPDGPYAFSLLATNAGGDSVSVTDIRALGYVTGVQNNGDGTLSLNLGSGIVVGTSAIDAVYNPSNLPKGTLGDPSSDTTS